MAIFSKQEMAKNRSVVTTKINSWYNWLMNYIPQPIKDNTSKAYKSFKDKILSLYDNLTHKKQPTGQEMDVFERQEMTKNRKVVSSKMNDFYNWLMNYMPEPIKDNTSKAYNSFKDKILGLYKNLKDTNQTVKEEARQEIEEGDLPEPKIRLIEDKTRVKKYEVTGNLNNNLSDLIFNNIKSVVEMRTKVVYSFSCDIFTKVKMN